MYLLGHSFPRFSPKRGGGFSWGFNEAQSLFVSSMTEQEFPVFTDDTRVGSCGVVMYLYLMYAFENRIQFSWNKHQE